MKRIIFAAVSFLALNGNLMAIDNNYTRGIGVYPGRPGESFAPLIERDTTYRNVALNRAVYQSSAFDYNLTGQLITDGIKTKDEPAALTVSVNAAPLNLRDKEKTIDGNVITGNVLMGENSSMRYDWAGMAVNINKIKILGEVAYRAANAVQGYEVTVMGANNGEELHVIGKLSGAGLPGTATEQQVSSDPNKQEATEYLPLRKVNTTIAVTPGTYSVIVISTKMKGGAYWRLYENTFMQNDRQQEVMPSYHFSSAWVSAEGGEQWVYTDLGTVVDFNLVNLFWVHKPLSGSVQVSNDAATWNTLAELPGSTNLNDKITCNGQGRYVRILMTQPDKAGKYALSEIEIMGRGGLLAKPQPVVGMKNGKYSLDGGNWKLYREGSDNGITATVPATVLSSYMNIGAVPNNVFSDNMQLISESFFNSDFTYRTHFKVPKTFFGKRIYLNFDGINWKAKVSINGNELGEINGAFIRGKFDVTDLLRGDDNLLKVKVIKNAHFGAVKTKNETSTDLNGGVLGADNPTFHASIGWDWITTTPGREVGIWNDVYLSANGKVDVSDPLITTTLNTPDTLTTITPSVWAENVYNKEVKAIIKGWIGDTHFEQNVTLAPNSKQEISFNPDKFTHLKNQRLRLWWPNGYGQPYLYDAGFSVSVDGVMSDSLHFKAGIREVKYRDINTETKIYVNGKRITPLGGNWGFSETNLNYRGREYDAAVRYHKDMNFNMIRDWVGQTGDEEFYQACDKYGIMVWQDFWLANPWDGPDPYNDNMFLANARDYINRIRNHSSITIYVGRNEGYPPKTIDDKLREYIAAQHPQLGYISSSADDGVSGHGPYWALSTREYFTNQTHKLHSERGMPNIPTYESLQRMLKPAELWPQGLSWAKHDFTMEGAQRGASFDTIVAKHFGKAQGAKQFSQWAQWLNYEGYRAMYESAQQDRMGLLIWMSHPCWPTMVWQTYDYYLEPTAAYFGVKKACEPLHIQYNPVKNSVEVVNMGAGSYKGLTTQAQVLSMYGKIINERTNNVDINEDQTVEALPITLPEDSVYYIRLYLKQGNKVLSENFYVQSKEQDNLLALNKLPEIDLTKTEGFVIKGDETVITATVSNPTKTPALMIRLNLLGSDSEQILPVIYSDNYFSLMPGDSKTVTIKYKNEDGRGVTPTLAVSHFNQKLTNNL